MEDEGKEGGRKKAEEREGRCGKRETGRGEKGKGRRKEEFGTYKRLLGVTVGRNMYEFRRKL